MAGYLLLAGGAEFGGAMALPDRRALELAGGLTAPVCIIPTAAAPDHNHQRAGQNGARWFRSLGARNVSVVSVIDAASANDPTLAAQLHQAGLIYLLGGFPGYLVDTLRQSACWQAARGAYERGAVLAGSSAGAMALCQDYFDPARGQVAPGLGLLPASCVLPHHNTFGQTWAERLARSLPQHVLLGIDEQTGLLNDGGNIHGASWRVYGSGAITLYAQGQTIVYRTGSPFALGLPPDAISGSAQRVDD